jgi:transcriptional regulator with PAS, ATPase and Fis domain
MPARRPHPEAATLTALSQDSLQVPALEIVASRAGSRERRATLGLTPIIVGKDPQSDIPVEDPRISRKHCSFTLTERGIVLRDLGSKNGTFVAGVQIVEAVLPPNVDVTLGSTTLSVRIVGGPSAVPLSSSPRFGGALGASVVMRALFAQLDRAAQTNETILILGESGTGKELIARAVHDRSPRRNGPFVVFDCGAVAPELVEAELFGAVRGAFTGAVANREGALAESDGGTLFLDEIGELPLDLQPKLLRALEARQFRALGSNAWRSFDARIVAATHRDLRAQMAARAFREDLYFRVAVVQIQVPPLRDRRDDIDLLIEEFLRAQNPPRTMADLSPGNVAMLKAHDWPGNVRELRNTVSRLLLFPHLGQQAFDPVVTAPGGLPTHLPLRQAREQVVEEFEQAYLVAKLREHNGNVSRAAEAMGVSRQFVHRMLEKYGIRSGR